MRWILASLVLISTAAQAEFDLTSVQKLWALPYPVTKKDAQGHDLIHVRIYPHEQKTPEKRAAEPLDHVTLEGPCQLYVGKANEAGSTGKKIGNLKPGAAAKFNISMAKLTQPLWLDCTGPVAVDHAPPLLTHKYEASFYIHRAESKEIPGGAHVEIIAVLPIDNYLRGVVPTEAIPSWPADALKTQAVAARSFAYFSIAHNQLFPSPKIYDVDDTNHFQAFAGISTVNPLTDAAVQATHAQILTYDKMVIPAFFDTDAGGQTESAKEVFNLEAPYCPVKPEPPEVVAAVKPWSITLKLTDVAKFGKVPAGRTIKSLSVLPADITPGKRVRVVTAELDNGTKMQIPVADFKKVNPGVKSALFTLTMAGDGVKVDGKGAGHGVGLDQIGMKVLAKAGWTYQKILGFYFNNVTLCSTAGAAPGGVPACNLGTPLAH